jgi:hypothetical protein
MEVTKEKEEDQGGAQEPKKPGIDPAIIEELLKDYQRPEDLSGPDCGTAVLRDGAVDHPQRTA